MSRRQKDLFPELPDGKRYVSDRPELVADWHPSRNNGKRPEDFTFGSNVKVWWRCEAGHEWQAAIFNRAIHGKGCPYCSGRKVSSTNNLLYLYPDVAKFWSVKNPVSADRVLARSGKTYIWECSNGHQWNDRPHNMAKKKFHCPECQYSDRGDGLRKSTAQFNLATEHPNIAREWHERNKQPPSYYMPKSNDKVWWRCEKGHEWNANIDSRTRGNGCPYCAGKLPSATYNLRYNFPHIAAEWHEKNDRSPEKFTPFSNKKVWWKCERGHEWPAQIANRTYSGNGCPKCSNQSSKNEIRILTELHAAFGEAVSRHKIEGWEVDIFLPDQNVAVEYDGKYWHYGKDAKDREKQNAVEGMGIKLLRVRESPLSAITKHDLIIPSGSLITKDQINQLVVRVGDEFNASYLIKAQFINDDLYRTYLDFFPSPFPEKSLKYLNPELSKEWHPKKNSPLTPSNFSSNAKQKVWWQCTNGHEWEAAIYSRNAGGHKCPYCMGMKATPETSLATTHPEIAAMWHPTKNGDATPWNTKAGSGIRRWWQCKKDPNHIWELSPDKMKGPRKSGYCQQCKSLGVQHPHLIPFWHSQKNGDVTPFDVFSGAGKKYWWRCLESPKHEWQVSPNTITNPNRKLGYCPYCSGRRKWTSD